MKLKLILLLTIFIFIGCAKQDSSNIKLLTQDASSWSMSYIDVYSYGGGPDYEYYGSHLEQGAISFDNGSGVYAINGKTFRFNYEISEQNYITFTFDSSLDVADVGNSAFLDDYLRKNTNYETMKSGYKLLMFDSHIILRRYRVYPDSSYDGEDKQYIEIFLFNESN